MSTKDSSSQSIDQRIDQIIERHGVKSESGGENHVACNWEALTDECRVFKRASISYPSRERPNPPVGMTTRMIMTGPQRSDLIYDSIDGEPSSPSYDLDKVDAALLQFEGLPYLKNC